jgi:RNA polymerase sigma-70 factor (ECF subfamily)
MNIDTTDLDLVRQSKLGNRNAFDRLVVKHQHKLACVISHYLKLPQQIEDVVQDTFIKAFLGIMAFREDSKFSTWLHRIGVNAAIDFLNAERRRIPLYQPPFNAITNELIVSEVVDDENPERFLATKQTISSVLSRLPAELRTVITLREIDGLNYKKIASIMACPVGTVRSRLSRARTNIAVQLRSIGLA